MKYSYEQLNLYVKRIILEEIYDGVILDLTQASILEYNGEYKLHFDYEVIDSKHLDIKDNEEFNTYLSSIVLELIKEDMVEA